jgi:MtaA/CmuA family methyltransferase
MNVDLMTGKERVLAVLAGKPVDCLPFMPITMMFAADRIGRPYREYVSDYRVLVEGQVRTAEEFDFDYVSVISDPAREAADCGARVAFFDNQPPAIVEEHALLAVPAALARLRRPDPLGGGRMHDRVRGVAALRAAVGNAKLVEGWIEGPIAEAADLRGLNTIMLDLVDSPGFVRDLFEFVLEMELQFARAQVEAGADIIGVGDAAASLIGPRYYEEFVWPYEKRLVDGLHAMGTRVRLHICGNTRPILAAIGRLGCEIVDLDYKAPVAAARERMGPDQVLLGNINPVATVRDGTPPSIAEAVAQCHRDAGSRFIVGAGCEITRDTAAENLKAMRDYARSQR